PVRSHTEPHGRWGVVARRRAPELNRPRVPTRPAADRHGARTVMNRLSFWMVSAGVITALAVGCGGDDDTTPTPASGGKAGAGGAAAGTAGSGGKSGSGSGGTSSLAGGGGQTSEPIEIEGTWVNEDFGETDIIADATWSSAFGTSDPSVYEITEFS